MTELPDAPVAALAIPGTQIVLGLNLYQCRPYTMIVKGEGVMMAMEIGRQAAMAVNGTLARRATSDQMSFYHLRERLRRAIVSTEGGRVPPGRLGSDPLRSLGSAFLWLSLHEPQKGAVLRSSSLECLMDAKRAVIQVACGPEIAYAIRISVNPQDMQEVMRLAANSTVPFAMVNRSDSKRTVH